MSALRRNPKRCIEIAAAFAALAFAVPVAPPAAAAVPAHGRAWELVTAGPTNGVRLLGVRAWSADGDAVVYSTLGPMPDSPSGELLSHGVASRAADGWQQHPVGARYSAPRLDLITNSPIALTGDFSAWLWTSFQPLLPGAPGEPDLGIYRMAADGSLTLLANAGGRDGFSFIATSDQLGHVAFDSTDHLLPGADAGRIAGTDAYDLVGSQLRLVGVDSARLPLSACGSMIGSGDAFASWQHPVSHDGERIFFTAPSVLGCAEPQRIYLREHDALTTEISASACRRTDCNSPSDVIFAGALADGSRAFLVTSQQLTDDDVDNSADLYRYDVATHALVRLSAGISATPAEVSGSVIRSSADGTRVYFVATGQPLAGAGEAGRQNLYLSDHGNLRFVATLDDLDLRSAQLSSDGGSLVFTTVARLTPTDTDDRADLYRYDAATGAFTEISDGVGGGADGEFDVSFGIDPIGSLPPQPPIRSMSDDGRVIVFLTAEALLPEDTDETTDLYEWRDGDLGLLSSGADDGQLTYAGLSADERSVFFTTEASLLPADRDNGDQDLYVARLGGGFPPPPPPAPGCDGDACQGPPGGRLGRSLPDSLTRAEPRPKPALLVRRPGRRALRQLAASGRATLLVAVPVGGRVSLVARARIGRRTAVVARAVGVARRASTVRLPVRLSARARRALRRQRSLRLEVVVRHAHLGAAPPLVLVLRRAR